MQNLINLEKSIGGEAALSVPNDILVLYKGQHDLVCRKLLRALAVLYCCVFVFVHCVYVVFAGFAE